MSENYQSKRERRQRILESLPAGLREQVSLRIAETVAALTPQAQERLLEAIQSGLKRLPRAVEQLRVNPDTPVEDLLNPPAQAVIESPTASAQHIEELADLIQLCFPDMPRISAVALASAGAMDIARQIAQAHDSLFQSNCLQTDFVMVVLYALMRQTLEHLEETISDTPALRQIFNQSALPWKPNDWRKQNA